MTPGFKQPVKCFAPGCYQEGVAVFRVENGKESLIRPPSGWRSRMVPPTKSVVCACPEHRDL